MANRKEHTEHYSRIFGSFGESQNKPEYSLNTVLKIQTSNFMKKLI